MNARRLALAALLFLLTAPPLIAQDGYTLRRRAPMELSGPRLGLTLLTGAAADSLRETLGIAPVISQFGWQFEKRFYASPDGLAGLVETVLLVGGMEQGAFLPSVSLLVGLRSASGTEFGAGPSLSVAGMGMAIAGGVTLRLGELNVPLNAAIVPAPSGIRFSLLTGFNMERDRMAGPLPW